MNNAKEVLSEKIGFFLGPNSFLPYPISNSLFDYYIGFMWNPCMRLSFIEVLSTHSYSKVFT